MHDDLHDDLRTLEVHEGDLDADKLVGAPRFYYVLKRMSMGTRSYAGTSCANADPSSTRTMTRGERR